MVSNRFIFICPYSQRHRKYKITWRLNRRKLFSWKWETYYVYWTTFLTNCKKHLHHKLLVQAWTSHPSQHLCPHLPDHVDIWKHKSNEDGNHKSNLGNNRNMYRHLICCMHHSKIYLPLSIQMGVRASCTLYAWVIYYPALLFPCPAFQGEHQLRDKPWLHGWPLHFCWHLSQFFHLY